MTGLILLASYPKSGNTWLRAVLTSLRQGGAPVDINALDVGSASHRGMFDKILDMETSDLLAEEIAQLQPEIYRRLLVGKTAPILLKAHDAWLPAPGAVTPPFPREVIQAVVYITRDPRDVAVSFAHHYGTSIDEAITCLADSSFVRGDSAQRVKPQVRQFLSTWSAHVESWLGSGLPLHCIRYEDMIADPANTFGTAVRFLGFPENSSLLSSALAASDFDQLQATERGKRFRESLPESIGQFFRQGAAGAWRDILMPEQAAQVVADHGAVMRRLGYA